MWINLENLELSAEQLDLARAQVRAWAYEKWRSAGSPPSDGVPYWLEAEREWISRNYVPWRPFQTPRTSDVDRAGVGELIAR